MARALIMAVLSNGLVIVGASDIWQTIIKDLLILAAFVLDRFRRGSEKRT